MSPQKHSGSNLIWVKAHNLQAILMGLLVEGQISRAGLAKRTSLSSAAVTNLANELIDEGIIAEVKPTASDMEEKRVVGRPQRMLQLIPRARYAIGVHIGIGLFRVAITDLYAEIIDNHIVGFDQETPALDVLEQIASEIESLIAETAIDPERILGVGVGASGLVHYAKGLNVLAPRLGWQNIHLREILEKRLGLPVQIDNNVRAMAIGEAFFGAGQGLNVLAFVYGRTGVGAGFVVNGQVFRGSGAGAGEIGHTIMIPENGQLCRCGQKGCLETLVTEPVIVRRAMELVEEYPASILAQKLALDDGSETIESIFAAVREGDETAKEMLEEQIQYLGIALANLVNVLNPEKIILGGVFAQGDDLIRPIASRVMRETAFGGLGDNVIIESTNFGWRAGVVGAAALALMEFFYQRTDGVL
jgi:glucokinase-like ROK family protein